MKAVKIYKKLAVIASIIGVISTIIGWFFFLDKVGIIEIKDLLLAGDDSSYSSDKVKAILQAAEKIHDYMRENDFYYPDPLAGPFDIRYNDGNSKRTCCATYVSWVLQEVGLIEDSEHSNWTGGVKGILDKRPDEWKFIEVKSFAEMQPGDIGCYHDGSSKFTHVNIYAGDNLFWDAGGTKNVRSEKPVVRGFPDMGVLRYIG